MVEKIESLLGDEDIPGGRIWRSPLLTNANVPTAVKLLRLFHREMKLATQKRPTIAG